MKKLHLSILCLFVLVMSASGNPVTQGKALQKATSFLKDSYAGKSINGKKGIKRPVPELTTAHVADRNTLYIFNVNESDGFVIVSGDDRTESILGYTDEGAFVMEEAPENLRYWLKEYERQILWIQEHGATTSSSSIRKAARADIAPKITTTWDQYGPYNNLLSFPEYFSGQLALTGCVATAMAQMMYYHKWPTAACAAIPQYTLNFTDGTSRTFKGLAATTFNWSVMKNSYSSSETGTAADEVAKLMRYCGQSVEMAYGLDGSGASSTMAAEALRNYFGYDEDVRALQRNLYDAAEWDDMIYNELHANRPVIYSGSTVRNEGHAFILDGYQNGKYHVNWGWSGSWNGYFLLSVLDPYQSNLTDPSGSEKAYAYQQLAIIGIQKPDGVDETDRRLTIIDLGLQEGYDYVLSYRIENQCGIGGTYDIAIGIIDAAGNVLGTLDEIVAGYPFSTTTWIGGAMMPGRKDYHKTEMTLTIVCKLSSASTYQPCIGWENHRLIAKPEHYYSNVFTLLPYTSNGISTNIRSILAPTDQPVYYQLNGTRTNKPGQGIYIINGRKTIIK